MVIGEISQGTFHPHYRLLGRIYLLRARLLTFFPHFVPRSEDLLPTENFSFQRRTKASIHWGKLYLLEKARLYVAADGDSEVYACYAALQSCYYLTAAYTKPEDTTLFPNTEKHRQLERDDCMVWAKRLRNHALLAYAKTGRQCYNAIKEKSGLPGEPEEHGRYSIERLPAIFEDRELRKGRPSDNREFLTLDISMLAINSDDLPRLTADHPNKSIYLFGTNACYLFLIRGLYLLCSDTTEEFEKNEPDEPIQWKRKLEMARRLFDMAWAIAEDGCSIRRNPKSQKKEVFRSFARDTASTDYTSREINSIRDLYPRRVNEVADIGKVFSAACKTLQLQLLPERDRPSLRQDITQLFSMLHGEYRLNQNPLLKKLILRQERYNGHLEGFFENASAVISSHQPESQEAYSDEEMTSHRDALMKALFATLTQEPEAVA